MSTAGIIRRKFAIGAITVREIRGLRLPFCEQESAVFGSLNGQTESNSTCLVCRITGKVAHSTPSNGSDGSSGVTPGLPGVQRAEAGHRTDLNAEKKWVYQQFLTGF